MIIFTEIESSFYNNLETKLAITSIKIKNGTRTTAQRHSEKQKAKESILQRRSERGEDQDQKQNAKSSKGGANSL